MQDSPVTQLELVASRRKLQTLPSLGATLLTCLLSLIENDLVNEESIQEMNEVRKSSVQHCSLTNYLWKLPEFAADFRSFCAEFELAHKDDQRESLILEMNERWNKDYFYKPHLSAREI